MRLMNDDMAAQPLLVEGLTVFDAADAKLGVIFQYGVEGKYITVQRGRVIPKDVFIPLSLVLRSDEKGIHLSRTKSEIRADPRFRQAPGIGGFDILAAEQRLAPSNASAASVKDIAEASAREDESTSYAAPTQTHNTVNHTATATHDASPTAKTAASRKKGDSHEGHAAIHEKEAAAHEKDARAHENEAEAATATAVHETEAVVHEHERHAAKSTTGAKKTVSGIAKGAATKGSAASTDDATASAS